MFGETVNGCQCVASARARCGLTAEVGRSKHVVTSDLVRAAYFLHGRHRTERNNSARIVARFQQANVVGAQAKLRIGLGGDAIGAAEKRKIVHVCRSKISLKRAEDVTKRHVHALRFDTIDFEPKLRDVRAKGREVVRQARRLICLHHHGESLRLQFIETGVAPILNEKFIATGVANAGHGRGRKGNDKSFGNLGANARVYLRQNRRHSLFAGVSLRKFLERQEHGRGVWLIAPEEIESSEFDRVEDARRFVRDLRNLVDDRLRAIEGSRVW